MSVGRGIWDVLIEGGQWIFQLRFGSIITSIVMWFGIMEILSISVECSYFPQSSPTFHSIQMFQIKPLFCYLNLILHIATVVLKYQPDKVLHNSFL